jgi:hypothetical protein
MLLLVLASSSLPIVHRPIVETYVEEYPYVLEETKVPEVVIEKKIPEVAIESRIPEVIEDFEMLKILKDLEPEGPEIVDLSEYSVAEIVTAQIVVERCMWYVSLVEDNLERYPIEIALVLSVMANESACLKTADDGHSIGLMQVSPHEWTDTRARLFNPEINVLYGMYILHSAIYNRNENPEHNIRDALGAYNCGWPSLNAGRCYWFGGYTYADNILDFWLPLIRSYVDSENYAVKLY